MLLARVAKGPAHQHVSYWTCDKRPTAADARRRLGKSAIHPGQSAEITGLGFASGEWARARARDTGRAPFGQCVADIFDGETAGRARPILSIPMVRRGSPLPPRRRSALVGTF